MSWYIISCKNPRLLLYNNHSITLIVVYWREILKGLWCLMSLSTIFQLYRGGSRRKPLTLTNFITKCCIEYTSPWAGFKLTTLVVICTDCTGIRKATYHTITTMTALGKSCTNISYLFSWGVAASMLPWICFNYMESLKKFVQTNSYN